MMTSETFIDFDQNALAIERQQRLRDSMRRNDTAVLLILDSVNIRYATGASNMTIFSTRTPSRYLLLFAEGPCILYEYFGCEHLAEDLPTIDDVRPARGLCYVSSNGDPSGQAKAMASEITNTITDSGLTIDKLAIDRFPFAVIDALRKQGFKLTDADPVFSASRRIKLEGEIVLIREALRRVIAAAEDMQASIEPGRRETEIWSDFAKPFIAMQGQYISTRLFQSGTRTFPYFQEASDRIVKEGDLICFDTDAVGFAGYCSDFSRSYLCGERPANLAQIDLHDKAKDQLDHNIELIKPGASYREIAEHAWPVPEQHNDSRYYCIGHGLGMSGEFPNIPHLRPGVDYPIDGEIEPGMIICIESYIGSAQSAQGIKLEDQLLVTDKGTERMSAVAPFDDRLMPAII